MKMAVFWVVAPCGVVEVSRRFRGACCLHQALIMDTASTSETSVNFYQTTRRNNLEDSHLHIRRRENLKSHYHPVQNHLRSYLLCKTVEIKLKLLF
jgi:hypothetical protein